MINQDKEKNTNLSRSLVSGKHTHNYVKTFLAACFILILTFSPDITRATSFKTLERRANNFTVGRVSIEIEEQNWDPSNNVVYPGVMIKKDPIVKNTGDSDIYVYLDVQVPRRTIRTYGGGNDLSAVSEETLDIFAYSVNPAEWVLIESKADNGYSNHIYAYTKDIVRPGEETTALFNEVTFAQALEGQIVMGTRLEMPLSAYAIQCEYLNETGVSIEDKMRDAFNKYREE